MSRTCKIGVLLFPEFSNHCLANAIEPLRAANTFLGESYYRWEFLTVDGETVHSSSGLPVAPEKTLFDSTGGDYLFVLPSYEFRQFVKPKYLRALQSAAKRFENLVGMDTGSWLLAAAELLNQRKATIHWDELDNFAEAFPQIDVVEDRYVVDDNILSCGGVSTTFELILELISGQLGPMFRLEVAALFMHGERSKLFEPTLKPTGLQTIDAAVALMRRHLSEPVTVAEIARNSGCSQRKLEQLFRQRLRESPRTVYKRIRLQEARRQIEKSNYSVAEIADRCGYINASAMTRAFREEFAITPQKLRKKMSLS
ncbi:GlxA family transcriptional regulator [Kiloniella sp. b19]|uniref:GlxA family transcriptional regulator n=1 Tax=Kiloniella sp. GXU_MW_B19 TaxID=3141326 RepID=UPI0031DFADEE